MNRIAALLAGGALALAAGTASAETITGIVKSFDAASMTLELDNGTSLPLQAGVDAGSLEAGAVVTLNVEEIDGVQVITDIDVN